MASIAPHVTCFSLTLFALAACGLVGMHWLPARLLAPLTSFSGGILGGKGTATGIHGTIHETVGWGRSAPPKTLPLGAAQSHNKKALHFELTSTSVKPHRNSAIEKALVDLHRGIFKPQVRCQTLLAGEGRNQVDVRRDMTFAAKITAYQANEQYDQAESELLCVLKTHHRPYRSLAAAAVLNLLGETYKMRTVNQMFEIDKAQQSFQDAANVFRQALQAALACHEVASEEAQAAYAGLNDVASELTDAKDQQVAAAALHRYAEDAKKLGIAVSPLDDPVVEMDTNGRLEPDAPSGFLHMK